MVSVETSNEVIVPVTKSLCFATVLEYYFLEVGICHEIFARVFCTWNEVL